MHKLKQSNRFLVKPTLLLNPSANDCTIPSPGFGTNCILNDIAAPTPVQIIDKVNTIKRIPKFCAVGIYVENIFNNRVNIKLSGNCNMSDTILL